MGIFSWGSDHFTTPFFERPDGLRFRRQTCHKSWLRSVFLAEYDLRQLTQQEEMVQRKVASLRKTAASEDDRSQLHAATKQLENIQSNFPLRERKLHFAVCCLPSRWREAYDDIISRPNWFMSKGLAQDCSRLHGCCSRGCGCCERRATSQRVTGRGHCTSDCWCCAISRGFELSSPQKKEIRDAFEWKLNSALFLCRLGNLFFSFKESSRRKPA